MTGLHGLTRGRPLATFAVFLGAWILLRVVTWEPLSIPLEKAAAQLPTALLARDHQPTADTGNTQKLTSPYTAFEETSAPDQLRRANPLVEANRNWTQMPLGADRAMPLEPPRPSAEPTVAVGHQLLWAAAMAHLPAPHRLVEQAVSPSRSPMPAANHSSGSDRWSLDAWAFWREGSNAISTTLGREPVYGASQAAAVLSYRLAPFSSRDPRAYVRAYKALVAGGESEVATGLSARLLAKLPLRAHGELRVTHHANLTSLRPAAFVTSELDPIPLPAGLQVEAYGQAGYVGGKGGTPFADGQLHIIRDIGGFDLGTREPAKVSLGGGAWGGAQSDSSRLDLGPRVRLDLRIGETPARLSVDWRERVAGDAEPDSGVAVTLSTRF